MTTIAVSRNQIAADKQATHSGGLQFKIKTKLFTFSNKEFYPHEFHVGLAGNLDKFQSILMFFQDPHGFDEPPKDKHTEGVILTGDGKIYTFSNPVNWMMIDEPFYAIGSGMNFAIGAMAMGATPKQAIQIASKYGTGSGMGVSVINL